MCVCMCACVCCLCNTSICTQPTVPIEMKLGVKIPWDLRMVCSYSMGNNSLTNLHNNAKDYCSKRHYEVQKGKYKLNCIHICQVAFWCSGKYSELLHQ